MITAGPISSVTATARPTPSATVKPTPLPSGEPDDPDEQGPHSSALTFSIPIEILIIVAFNEIEKKKKKIRYIRVRG